MLAPEHTDCTRTYVPHRRLGIVVVLCFLLFEDLRGIELAVSRIGASVVHVLAMCTAVQHCKSPKHCAAFVS